MSDDFTKWFGLKGGLSSDPFGNTTMVELDGIEIKRMLFVIA